jgi:hypothetical protein
VAYAFAISDALQPIMIDGCAVRDEPNDFTIAGYVEQGVDHSIELAGHASCRDLSSLEVELLEPPLPVAFEEGSRAMLCDVRVIPEFRESTDCRGSGKRIEQGVRERLEIIVDHGFAELGQIAHEGAVQEESVSADAPEMVGHGALRAREPLLLQMPSGLANARALDGLRCHGLRELGTVQVVARGEGLLRERATAVAA